MPYINLSNSRLYYEIEGEGPEEVVFGHSLLFNLRMFDDQVDFLKSNYRCIRFDFRGQGKSEITEGGYDLDTLTTDIVELLNKLCKGPCHFVGFSMGGMVGMRLAIHNSNLLKSLILINTSSETESKVTLPQNLLLAWIGRHIGLSVVANKVMAKFFGRSFLNDLSRAATKRIWKEHFLANDRKGISKAIKGVLFRESITNKLHHIHIPTLIIVGENDIPTPVEKSKIMQRSIKGSRLKIIPRAGHMSPVEEPDLVNETIDAFLSEF